MPTRPSVLPVTWVPSRWVGRQPVHCPARTWRSPSPARRATMSSNVRAVSAVASVSTSGVLDTASPRALAASVSMWLNPTPKLARILARRGSTDSTSAVSLSVTVQRRASALRNASRSPSGPSGASLVLSRASKSRASSVSTGSGSRRVTTTVGRVVTVRRPFAGTVSWPTPLPPWSPARPGSAPP